MVEEPTVPPPPQKAKPKAPKKKRSKTPVDQAAATKPKFPYTTKPGSLRKFLELVPTKPRPTKVNFELLKAWGMKDTNDASIIRVLKDLGLVGQNNETTDKYVDFMTPGKGPGVLGAAIRIVWAPLFGLSHQPHREDDATLRNYFNIHSGGSESTISQQIQTFKAACDFAVFDGAKEAPVGVTPNPAASLSTATGSVPGGAVIHIDLHIHLPENKAARDYEYIFEDIAKHLLGRQPASKREG